MSNLESFIWHFLGYSAMPVIILSGFVGVAAVSLWLLSLGKDKEVESASNQSTFLPIWLTENAKHLLGVFSLWFWQFNCADNALRSSVFNLPPTQALITTTQTCVLHSLTKPPRLPEVRQKQKRRPW